MTVVGIISDTHGKLAPGAYSGLADVDFIIHAGDIGGPAILNELKTLAPVYAVLGNNDYDEYGPAVNRCAKPVIDGVRFLVAHYPQEVWVSPNEERPPQVRIHGHTHDPYIKTGRSAAPAELLMCPGSTYRARGYRERAYGKVYIEDGQVVKAELYNLDGDLMESVDL